MVIHNYLLTAPESPTSLREALAYSSKAAALCAFQIGVIAECAERILDGIERVFPPHPEANDRLAAISGALNNTTRCLFRGMKKYAFRTFVFTMGMGMFLDAGRATPVSKYKTVPAGF